MLDRSVINNCDPFNYEGLSTVFHALSEASKVIHTVKNLFCNVALICNLVQEFNGLVSKGLAI